MWQDVHEGGGDVELVTLDDDVAEVSVVGEVKHAEPAYVEEGEVTRQREVDIGGVVASQWGQVAHVVRHLHMHIRSGLLTG